MPTYSYRCTECGTAFDIQQAFADDSLTVCMNCGGKLRKLFHAVGVSFSGSGFYRNDSRAGENTAREKKENAGADAAPAAASAAPAKEAASASASAPSKPADSKRAASGSAPSGPAASKPAASKS
ncbi:MAG TPA: FmdB family zinc ribbon protein [Pseudolysinimonas sp.]